MSLPELSPALKRKFYQLQAYIRTLNSLVVACSGGVDSTLLLAVAHEVLGDRVLAVTGADVSVPSREVEFVRTFCAARGIRHVICPVNPLKEAGYRHNSPDRCYFCKKILFTALMGIAREKNIEHVAEGSNRDDTGDYRPGLRAAAELSVKSPLKEAGLGKEEIRLLAKALGLPIWDKPASACLASRFSYGEEITEEKLRCVERAEQFLMDSGFRQVRVRIHGHLARIEVSREDIEKLAEEKIRQAVCKEFRRIGFLFTTLDLEGYRTGSMNATLSRETPAGFPGR